MAGGFAVREQSAEGQGSSFAGVAAGTNGLSAMFWNPATISQHNDQGYTSESNISLILPNSEAEGATGFVGNPDSGNIGVLGIVPASYSVYGLTDEITLGLAVAAPYGLATNADQWMGSLHGDKSEISRSMRPPRSHGSRSTASPSRLACRASISAPSSARRAGRLASMSLPSRRTTSVLALSAACCLSRRIQSTSASASARR